MGIFDFFKSKPSDEGIRKQVQKAKEAYAQPDYRRMAMEKLLKWDTDESIKGLLERFCVVVQSPHWDEEEKLWLIKELVNKGQRVLPILKEFIHTKNDINHALFAIRQILNDDESFIKLAMESLKMRAPLDHRGIQAKQELIKTLAEIKPTSLHELILPYFHDHSDDVQYEAIEALKDSEHEEVRFSLVKLLSSELHSPRILRKAALIVAERKIPVNDINLQETILEDYFIKNNLLLKK